jgi:hypothetical protein
MERSRRSILTATARFAAILAPASMLHACGFKPLYGGGQGDGAAAGLSQVRIVSIPDRSGQLLYNDLRESIYS